MTRLLEHPVADGHDQTAGLGGRDEDIGRDQAAMLVVPADQGLEADRAARSSDRRSADSSARSRPVEGPVSAPPRA